MSNRGNLRKQGEFTTKKGIAPTLNTCGGGGHEVKILEEKRILGGLYIKPWNDRTVEEWKDMLKERDNY